ncbi:putative integral membrane protein [Streptomyces albus]|uniref:Putative integral membrane protein n=1 Tax=Streptomyces albus (strain ATCC 21838 / DSM 41398 / FERM P-419 / JCM 4703 / NBRC 107858) TaxID=1081613 RepID=A0A0B5FAY4_STRA4|nr:putative integral membrane protein [Streptomyces albus]AOU81928.1 putative integral membrane protein [Streptomyces albus]AYN37613.1 hypothetical protein DUI70_7120 [Streptomyces albus]
MAATDEVTGAEDDALYVLTAVLLTPAQFPSVLGDDYPEACAALGMEPAPQGYGLVLGQDGEGARWTVVVDDVSLVAVAIASWDCGMEYDLSPDERAVVAALPGWPLALAVATPGVPAPHDPAPDPEFQDQRPLSPPDTESWGPAQRRLGADEIALQWAAWRAQIDDADFALPGAEGAETPESTEAPEGMAGPGPEGTQGSQGGDDSGSGSRTDSGTGSRAGSGATGQSATDDDGGAEGDAGTAAAPGGAPAQGTAPTEDPPVPSADTGSHPGIKRVLAEAHGYLDRQPPVGRVRSAFAHENARTLRVDGPGWSMVARTDDIAFVLLDEEPGEVLPVGRGSALPALLDALDRMAVRPA